MIKKDKTSVKDKEIVPSKERVNEILAGTDWGKYWENVAKSVKPEIEAYDLARARSLADASRRILL